MSHMGSNKLTYYFGKSEENMDLSRIYLTVCIRIAFELAINNPRQQKVLELYVHRLHKKSPSPQYVNFSD